MSVRVNVIRQTKNHMCCHSLKYFIGFWYSIGHVDIAFTRLSYFLSYILLIKIRACFEECTVVRDCSLFMPKGTAGV